MKVYLLCLGNDVSQILDAYTDEETAKKEIKKINDGTRRELNLVVIPLEVKEGGQ